MHSYQFEKPADLILPYGWTLKINTENFGQTIMKQKTYRVFNDGKRTFWKLDRRPWNDLHLPVLENETTLHGSPRAKSVRFKYPTRTSGSTILEEEPVPRPFDHVYHFIQRKMARSGWLLQTGGLVTGARIRASSNVLTRVDGLPNKPSTPFTPDEHGNFWIPTDTMASPFWNRTTRKWELIRVKDGLKATMN